MRRVETWVCVVGLAGCGAVGEEPAATGAAPSVARVEDRERVGADELPGMPVTPPEGGEPGPAEAAVAAATGVTPVAVSRGRADEFRLAAYRDGALALFSASNGVTLVVGAQAIAEAAPGEQLSRRPGMTRGFLDPGVLFLERWQTGTVGGRWPDSTWISAYFEGNRSISPFFVYYRKGDRWQRKANTQGLLQWYYAAFSPWTAGQTLALRVSEIDPRIAERHSDENGLIAAWERRALRERAAARPRLEVIDPAPGAAAPPEFPPDVEPRVFTARPTGEIDAFVEHKDGGAMSLHWAPGAAEPQRFRLPGPDSGGLPAVYGLSHAYAPDGALWVGSSLYQKAYVARFDGRAWTMYEHPGERPVRSLSIGPDGVVWTVTARDREGFFAHEGDTSTLWRSDDGRNWQAVPLPSVQFADMAEVRWEFVPDQSQAYVPLYGDAERAREVHAAQPYQVLAAGDDVWVVAMVDVAAEGRYDGALREVVFRRGPVVTPLAMPSDNALRLELLDERPDKGPRSIEEGCGGVVAQVLFMHLPADAPTSGPLPQVERLLTSHPELVTDLEAIWEARHHGKRVIAFVVRTLERARVAALLAALNEIVPEKRSLVCTQPIVARPLRTPEEISEASLAYHAAHPPV